MDCYPISILDFTFTLHCYIEACNFISVICLTITYCCCRGLLLLLSRPTADFRVCYSCYCGIMMLLSRPAAASFLVYGFCLALLMLLSRFAATGDSFCCEIGIVSVQQVTAANVRVPGRLIHELVSCNSSYFIIRSSPNTPELHPKVLMLFLAK